MRNDPESFLHEIYKNIFCGENKEGITPKVSWLGAVIRWHLYQFGTRSVTANPQYLEAPLGNFEKWGLFFELKIIF